MAVHYALVRSEFRIKIQTLNRTNNSSGIGNSVQNKSVTVDISSISIKLSRLVKNAPSPQYGITPIDYTNNIKLTGDKTINALLAAGNSWWNTGPGADGSDPAASADHTLTFSFADDTSRLSASTLATDGVGFQALSSEQKDVIRDVFTYISSVVNITFTEDGSGNGQIKVGSNDQGGASGGYAYYPNSGGDGGPGGQVLLANDQATFSDAAAWDTGGYEWETIVHEIGHALGLKHPGNYNAGGGSTPGPYLAKKLDTRTNSIMSYNNDAKQLHLVEDNGLGGLVSSYINPDSYQISDIAALQYLYGAATTASPNSYTFSDDEQFSRTIFDSNSASEIDLTGMTQSSIVDLRGGYRSSIGIRDAYADTGMTKDEYSAATSGGIKLSKLIGVPTYTGANNLGIAIGSQIRTATGGDANDTLISGSEIGGAALLDGGAGDDNFFIASGDATISDTAGANDSVFVAKKSGTTWTVSEDHATLTQKDKLGATVATVSLTGIEHVGFWNGKTLKVPKATSLSFSPVEQKKVLAYASVPKTASRLHILV